ncbi:MAG: ribosome maturation factor RimM [Eubacteriaceae bacterium]|jgi:16S rRNA processing protein RimM
MITEKMKVGKITGAHGIAGELKVMPITDDPERFAGFESIWIGRVEYPVQSVRLHQGKILLKLEGVPDRTAAEKLKGSIIEINREEAQELEEDEFYIADLLGSDVYDRDGNKVGRLLQVIQTSGGSDTAEISVSSPAFRQGCKDEKQAKRPLYLPFRHEFFIEISPESGKIVVDIPKEYWAL